MDASSLSSSEEQQDDDHSNNDEDRKTPVPIKYGSYYGKPVAHMMCELAAQLAYMDSHLLWCAIEKSIPFDLVRNLTVCLFGLGWVLLA
jgi:hypothetical protein